MARHGEQVVNARPPCVRADDRSGSIEIRHAVGAVIHVPDCGTAGCGGSSAPERIVGVGLRHDAVGGDGRQLVLPVPRQIQVGLPRPVDGGHAPGGVVCV